MPFKLGHAPIRRSLKYLDAGRLVFREKVKVMTVNLNEYEGARRRSEVHPLRAPTLVDQPYWVKGGPQHEGASEFVAYDLPRIQHKNPDVQCVVIKNQTPSPFITCYLENGTTTNYYLSCPIASK